MKTPTTAAGCFRSRPRTSTSSRSSWTPPPTKPFSKRTRTRTFPMSVTQRDEFLLRHIGPRPADLVEMLRIVRAGSLDELIEQTIPAAIRTRRPLELAPPLTEHEALTELRRLGSRNRHVRAYIGMGYAEAILPPVIQRNILENPGWYTAYTPYQAEISQGRLEALLNFQTMIMDL